MEAKQFTFRMPALPRWVMADEIGYEPKTTFWQDFCIAEKFGVNAIKDTFKRAFTEWRTDVVYLTELALVTNHRGTNWYFVSEKLRRSDKEEERKRADVADWLKSIYFGFYNDIVVWARENCNDDDLYYFESTID